jgi:hypothetical protein
LESTDLGSLHARNKRFERRSQRTSNLPGEGELGGRGKGASLPKHTMLARARLRVLLRE